MTEPTKAGWGKDARVIVLICAAHFVSHYHLMLLPPILELVKTQFGASYLEIGVAFTAFNIVSAALQAPAGFLVDRIGPRRVLTAGLVLGAVALVFIALVPTYWALLVAYAFLGLANTVYHPADYAILSASIDPKRIGRAFSIHTFSGYLGSGVAPSIVILSAGLWGWSGAALVAAAMGGVVASMLLTFGAILVRPSPAPTTARAASTASQSPSENGWRLLFSAPILRNLFFFMLLALSNGGLQTYGVVALGALHGTPATIANIALSGYLLLSAAGVLLGGVIADRTRHHQWVATCCFVATSAMVVLIGWVNLGAAALVVVMSAGGLLNGIIQPSRDMMVRAVTPPGSFGKVFGFVSTGFNIGGVVSPLLYATLMDRGEPRLVFAFIVAFILLAILTLVTRPRPATTGAPVARPAE